MGLFPYGLRGFQPGRAGEARVSHIKRVPGGNLYAGHYESGSGRRQGDVDIGADGFQALLSGLLCRATVDPYVQARAAPDLPGCDGARCPASRGSAGRRSNSASGDCETALRRRWEVLHTASEVPPAAGSPTSEEVPAFVSCLRCVGGSRMVGLAREPGGDYMFGLAAFWLSAAVFVGPCLRCRPDHRQRHLRRASRHLGLERGVAGVIAIGAFTTGRSTSGTASAPRGSRTTAPTTSTPPSPARRWYGRATTATTTRSTSGMAPPPPTSRTTAPRLRAPPSPARTWCGRATTATTTRSTSGTACTNTQHHEQQRRRHVPRHLGLERGVGAVRRRRLGALSLGRCDQHPDHEWRQG